MILKRLFAKFQQFLNVFHRSQKTVRRTHNNMQLVHNNNLDILQIEHIFTV